MAHSHKQLLGLINGFPDDPLATMLRETSLNTCFDFPAAQTLWTSPLPGTVPLTMLCELFTDYFADFTLPAGTDTRTGAFAAEWPTDDLRQPDEEEPSS